MNSLEKLILKLRFAGLGNALRAYRYTREKARLDRAVQPARPASPGRPPGRALETRPAPGGARIAFEHATLELIFLAPDLARISWSPGIPPLPYALARQEWPPVDARFSAVEGGWRLQTAALQVDVCPDGSLDFAAPAGDLLHRQLPPLNAASPPAGAAWTARAALRPGERLYGLGEHTGGLDLVGQVHRLWNTSPGGSYGPGQDPLYAPMPVVLGLHPAGGYLLFYENPFPGSFTAGPARLQTDGSLDFQDIPGSGADLPGNECGFSQIAFEAGLLRYYFIPGAPAQALERFTALVGRPELPPRWSLGYHQSRWGYRTAEEVRAVVAGFQQNDLPLGAIHLDIDYMDGYRVFQVDQARFPNLAGLADELHARGVRLVTIIDPGLKTDRGFDLYRDGLEKKVYCTRPDGRTQVAPVWPGHTAFPDFTDPKVRDWWSDQYPRLLDAGVDGFWHDMNEPEAFTAQGDMTLPLGTHHHMEGRGGDHRQAHNLYGLLMNRAGYEGLRRHRPQRRPWLVSRSGWAGSARYAWNWTGDVESSWQGLRQTLVTILGLGLSGQPFSGADIGGFSGNPDAELYLRWFQMAAFLPFFRTHSALHTARREPWVFGEPYTRAIRKALKLRCRLIPYIYTLAWEAAQTGSPPVRPLFWYRPDDSRLGCVEDAFLLGPALLVAPVLEPEAAWREVTLPAGRWYGLWDEQVYDGPNCVRLPVSLENIAVLARGGAVLPLEADGELQFHLYPPAITGEHTSQLYLDAGDGYPQSSLDWRLDRMSLRQAPGKIELTWEQAGDFPFPYNTVAVHLHGISPRQARLDGKNVLFQAGALATGAFQTLSIEINETYGS